MKLLHRAAIYYRIAYRSDHFPSSRRLLSKLQRTFAYYGFLGDRNFGDELVFEAARVLFKPHVLLPVRTRMPLHLKAFARFCKTRFSGIIVGGGTLIGPFWNEEFFAALIDLRLPVYVHGTGVRSDIEKPQQWQYLLADQVYGGVRGPLSLRNLARLNRALPVTGDAAFMMHTTTRSERRQRKTVLINCGSHRPYVGEENARESAVAFAEMLVREGIEVQFLPMHSIDVDIGRNMKQRVPKLVVLDVPANYEQARMHFQRSAFCVGERLHFTALAIVESCPFLSINYGEKHSDLLASVGLAKAGMAPTELTTDNIVSAFEGRDSFDWSLVLPKLQELSGFQQREASAFLDHVN